MSLDLGSLIATLGADIDPLVAAVTRANRELDKYADKVTETSRQSERSSSQASSAMNTLSKAISFATSAYAGFKASQYIADATMLSARYETLGIVLTVIGNNAGKTATEMNAVSAGLQKTGISMLESRDTLIKLTQAHIDLSNATKLARIAQDAAVIGNTNSSEAFSRLIYGIQSAQTEVLRTIGINVSFEQSYAKLAAELGRAVSSLTETEKTQARVNAVMEKGADIAGIYEAAMETTGKKAGSLARYFENIKIQIGDAFNPALGVLIDQLTDHLKGTDQQLKDMGPTIQTWALNFSTFIIELEAEITRFAMLLDKLGGTLTSVAHMAVSLLTIQNVGVMEGDLPDPEEGAWAKWLREQNENFEKQYVESEKRMEQHAKNLLSIQERFSPAGILSAQAKIADAEQKRIAAATVNTVASLKDHETASKSAAKALNDYNNAMQSIQDRMAELTMTQDQLAQYKLDEKMDKYAEAVGKTNPVLQELIKLEQQRLDIQKAAKASQTEWNDPAWAQFDADAAREYQQTISDIAKAEKDAADQSRKWTEAARNMWKDLGESSSGYYAAESQAIQAQVTEYLKLAKTVEDVALVKAWEAEQNAKLMRKQTLEFGSFIDGVKVGYDDMLKDQMTWAEAGLEVYQGFTRASTIALSDGLFKVITGDMESLSETWDSLWQNMLKTFLDVLSQMAIEWAAKGVANWLTSDDTWSTVSDVGDALGDILDFDWYATGGQYDPNKPFWAGEQGPELIDPRTRTVYNNKDSMKIAGSYPGYASGTVDLSGTPFFESLNDFIVDLESADTALVEFEQSLNGLSDSVGESTQSISQTTTAIDGLAESTDSAAESTTDFGNAMNYGKVAWGAAETGLGLLTGSVGKVVHGLKTMYDGIMGISDATQAAIDAENAARRTALNVMAEYEAAMADMMAADMAVAESQMALDDATQNVASDFDALSAVADQAIDSLGGLADSANGAADGVGSLGGPGDSTGYGGDTGGSADHDGYASGGRYDPNKLFWAGERGMELIDPASRTVLSHEDSIRYAMQNGINIPAYANGTTTFPWYSDPATHSSGTTEMDMWEDLYEQTEQYLDLLTDLQSELQSINDYYQEQIELAIELAATEEELNSIYAMQQAAVAALSAEFITEYNEYVNEMLGLTSDLGSELNDLNQYFIEAIQNANALGASNIQLIKMLKDWKDIQDELIAQFENDYQDYVAEMLGLNSDLANSIDEVNDYYQEVIQSAMDAGYSQEQLNQMYADQAAIIEKLTQDLIDNVLEQSADLAERTSGLTIDEQLFNDIEDLNEKFLELYNTLNDEGLDTSQLFIDYAQAVSNLMQDVADSILSKLDDVNDQIERYNWDIANPGGSTAQYLAEQIGSLYGSMMANPSQMTLENISSGAELLVQWYSAAVSEAESNAQEMADAVNKEIQARESATSSIESFVESLEDAIKSIKYSNYNLALPKQKAEEAAKDYAALRAKAFSSTATLDEMKAFQDFATTYLQQTQDAYKSSEAYQAVYSTVMADLESLKLQAQSVSFEQRMVDELEEINDNLADMADYLDLSAINAAFFNAQNEITRLVNNITGSTGSTGSGSDPAGLRAQSYSANPGMELGYYNTATGPFYSAFAFAGRSPGEMLFAIAYNTSELASALGKIGYYAEGTIATSPTLGMIGEAGYPEAVIPMKSGYVPVRITGPSVGSGLNDPEIKQLLTGILAAQNKRQNVTLTLENGRTLKGYVQATADELDQARYEKKVTSRNYR